MRTTINVARAVLLAVLIISMSVTAVLCFRPIYYSCIDSYNIEEASGMSREEIVENYDALIDYNMIWGPDQLEFPTLPSSEEGLIHFAEVKDIFTGLQAAGIASAVLLAGSLMAGRLVKVRRGEAPAAGKKYSWLKYGGIIACVLPLTVMTCAGLWWDKAFVVFHEIMFDNDYWIFDADRDPVITMLPDEFFFRCCMAIGILILVLSGASYIAYRKLRRRENAH